MWREWDYSSVMEWALQLAKKKREMNEQLESLEDPMSALMTLLMQKLR